MSKIDNDRMTEIIKAHIAFLEAKGLKPTEEDCIAWAKEFYNNTNNTINNRSPVGSAVVSLGDIGQDLYFAPGSQDFTMYGPEHFQKPLASYRNNDIKEHPETGSYYCAFSTT